MKVKPIGQCRTVAELLSTPHRWCREVSAKNAHGHEVNPNAVGAARFCLIGAVNRVYKSNASRNLVNRRLDKALDRRQASDCVSFNDRSTHAQVLRLVKEARV